MPLKATKAAEKAVNNELSISKVRQKAALKLEKDKKDEEIRAKEKVLANAKAAKEKALADAKEANEKEKMTTTSDLKFN
jgi:hypothetical protein